MTTDDKVRSDSLKKVYSSYKIMLSYCLKCRKNTESKIWEAVKQKPKE